MEKYDEGRKEVIANVEKIIQLLKDVCQKYGTKEEDLPSNLRGILEDLRTYVTPSQCSYCSLILLKRTEWNQE